MVVLVSGGNHLYYNMVQCIEHIAAPHLLALIYSSVSKQVHHWLNPIMSDGYCSGQTDMQLGWLKHVRLWGHRLWQQRQESFHNLLQLGGHINCEIQHNIMKSMLWIGKISSNAVIRVPNKMGDPSNYSHTPLFRSPTGHENNFKKIKNSRVLK